MNRGYYEVTTTIKANEKQDLAVFLVITSHRVMPLKLVDSIAANAVKSIWRGLFALPADVLPSQKNKSYLFCRHHLAPGGDGAAFADRLVHGR
jgi:hypothetical protein